MDSKENKVEKKQETPKKGQAFVDTSDSKVVKGSDKAEVEKDKVIVEGKNMEEVLADITHQVKTFDKPDTQQLEDIKIIIKLKEKRNRAKSKFREDYQTLIDELQSTYDGKYTKVSEGVVVTANNLEEFLRDLAGYRDTLHDFGVDNGDRTQATQALYEMITGKTIEPSYDEDGELEELSMDWEQFGTYWDEIEETAKNISIEKMKEVIDTFKYDLDANYHGESLKQDLINALNEAIDDNTMNASEVNSWLKENNLSEVIEKIKDEDGKYNVEDIIKLISDEKRKELQSEVVSDIKLDEGVASENDAEMDEDNEEGNDEKDSSNAPELPSVKESNEEEIEEETELTSDDENFDIEGDNINEDVEGDSLDEFREMARAANSLEDFIHDIRTKNDVPAHISDEFFTKYGKDGATPEQAAEILYNEVKGTMNENIHQDMKRLIHLMSLKESANELVNKFGLTSVDSIKESLDEELTNEEYTIILEDVYTTLNIEVDNDFSDETESLNESLRSDLHDKLI